MLIELFTDRKDAEAMGVRARQVFEQQAGATTRSIDALREVLQLPSVSPATASRQGRDEGRT